METLASYFLFRIHPCPLLLDVPLDCFQSCSRCLLIPHYRYRIRCLCFCLYITESQKRFIICKVQSRAKISHLQLFYLTVGNMSHLGTSHFSLDFNQISSTLLCNWSENVKKSSKVKVHVYGSLIWLAMLLKVHWRYQLCISERVSELNLYASLNFNPQHFKP